MEWWGWTLGNMKKTQALNTYHPALADKSEGGGAGVGLWEWVVGVLWRAMKSMGQ